MTELLEFLLLSLKSIDGKSGSAEKILDAIVFNQKPVARALKKIEKLPPKEKKLVLQ